LLALHNHPAVKRDGLLLLRSAREIKGVAGLDCVADSVGPQIAERAKEYLTSEFSSDQTASFVPPPELSAAMRVRVRNQDCIHNCSYQAG